MQSSWFHSSSSLSRELTEGTPTTRETQSGFVGKLKQGVTNLVTRQQDTAELTQEQGVDRYGQSFFGAIFVTNSGCNKTACAQIHVCHLKAFAFCIDSRFCGKMYILQGQLS